MFNKKQICLSLLCLITGAPFNLMGASQQRQNRNVMPKHTVVADNDENEESLELSALDKGAIAIALLLAGYGIYAYRDELGNVIYKKGTPEAVPASSAEDHKSQSALKFTTSSDLDIGDKASGENKGKTKTQYPDSKASAESKLQLVNRSLKGNFSFVLSTSEEAYKTYKEYEIVCFHLEAPSQANDWSFGLTDQNELTIQDNRLLIQNPDFGFPTTILLPTAFSRLVQTLAQNQESYAPLNCSIVTALAQAEQREVFSTQHKASIEHWNSLEPAQKEKKTGKKTWWSLRDEQIADTQDGLSFSSFKNVLKTISSKNIDQFTSFFYLYALGYLKNLKKEVTGAKNSELGTMKTNLETFPMEVRKRMNGWRNEYEEKNKEKWQDISSRIHLAFFSALLKQTSVHSNLLEDLSQKDKTSTIAAVCYTNPDTNHDTKRQALIIDAKGVITKNKTPLVSSKITAQLFGIPDVQLYIESRNKNSIITHGA